MMLSRESETYEFSVLFRESVRKGLRDVLGDTGMGAVYFHAKLRGVDDPEELHARLYRLFRPGAAVIEEAIAKALFLRLNLSFRRGGAFEFERAIEMARLSLPMILRRNRLIGDQEAKDFGREGEKIDVRDKIQT